MHQHLTTIEVLSQFVRNNRVAAADINLKEWFCGHANHPNNL